MTLLRWLTFLLGSLTVTITALLFWIYLFLLTLVFVLQWFSLHWEILIMLLSQFQKGMDASFYCIAHDYYRADWDGIRDHLRDDPWDDVFKFSASAAASKFCEWVQVGIDVYIPHCKYQIKPHSSPWFSAAFATAIAHRNIVFCLYQQNESSDFKVKFRQASNCSKRVLEAAKLAYANKTKESRPRNVALRTFEELLILFSTKVNLLYLLNSKA